MTDLAEEFSRIIQSTHLSEKETLGLLHVINQMQPDEAEALLQLFKEQPESIRALSHNLRMKNVLLATGDSKSWQTLIDDETYLLQSIDRQS